MLKELFGGFAEPCSTVDGDGRKLKATRLRSHASRLNRIPMNEIVSALSYALDLTEGALPGHAVRSCLYGMRIAEELNLTGLDRSSLYYALLLKDIGRSTAQASGSGAPDALRHDGRSLDWTRPSLEAVTALWQRALPLATPAERALWVLNYGPDSQKSSGMIAISHDRGANIARKIGLSTATEEAIRLLDEHWDGSGYPERRRGSAIPLFTRIVAVAQMLDTAASQHGLEQAAQELEANRGKRLDPHMVDLTIGLIRSGKLEAAVGTFDHHLRVMEILPGTAHVLAAEDVDLICEAFGDIVDAKSSFTYSHSMAVARVAVGIARQLGFRGKRCRLIHRASLLHDLGKLSVPNSILYKWGELDPGERECMMRHPLLSQQILQRISQFDEIAKIAGQHHEKLDGSGYPLGLKGDQLSMEVRVVILADMYSALAESRPYRKDLETDEIVAILKRDVPSRLDPDCFEALLRFLAVQDPEAADLAPDRS